jgi:DOPA 4,5-dioxygenase
MQRAEIREFHAHTYFRPETRARAAELREELLKVPGLTVYTLADGPRGPHGAPMFGCDIPAAQLADVLGFLMLNHGPLSVLLHPVTGNELLDHTHHALWLGPPQPLDLATLV